MAVREDDPELSEIYDFFIKNYKESLFAPYEKIPDRNDRMNEYITNILQIKIDEIRKKIMHHSSFTLKFKKNPDIIPDNVNYILYHGQLHPNRLGDKIVPESCIICFLTPMSYLLCKDALNNKNITDILFKPDFCERFKESPFCIDKEYKKNSIIDGYSRIINFFFLVRII